MKILDFRFWILDLVRRNTPNARIAVPSNPKSKIQNPKFRAFSLVEVLAAVALIGIITFLALPNIVSIKQDSEKSLAIARAEAINLSMASYLQALGQASATTNWSAAANDNARYALLQPYLAYAPSAFSDYMPGGYSITLPTAILNTTTHRLVKVPLTGPDGSTVPY